MKAEEFDPENFDRYREDNRIEVKDASGGLPNDLWETYSAFANSYGGVIILGFKENLDRSWKPSGLHKEDVDSLLKQFWDTVHNTNKVSSNLLSEDDIHTFEVEGNFILVIHIPKARSEEKPVYINNNLFKGTYKRNHEGDYRCTELQVKSMLRDQSTETSDMRILEDTPLEYLDVGTINRYRIRHRGYKPGHPWEHLDTNEYLEKIGAAGRGKDTVLHPTVAGLLMFGEEYHIVRVFPEYFLDYREELDPKLRWTDRVESSSGEWTGNLFDFYFRVYNKLIQNIKTPFKLVNGNRIDDTPVHKALREALANCLVNADIYVPRGVVIIQNNNQITFENPGSIKVGKYQMKNGGISDPRNKALMKMFNLIDIGERAGSGIPEIFTVWKKEGWVEPQIDETISDIERTKVTLSFKESDANKEDAARAAIHDIPKLSKCDWDIIAIIRENPSITQSEIQEITGLSPKQTRAHIEKLKTAGVLKRSGSRKTGVWVLSLDNE